MTKIDTTTILSGINGFEHLETVLQGYNNQTYRLFEIVIVTDRFSEDLKQMVERVGKEVFYDMHLATSENVLKHCHTNYLIFSNANVLPRKDFVEQHVKSREEGYFLKGRSVLFEKPEKVTVNAIYDNLCFNVNWLRENGFDLRAKKDPTICNASAWKNDVEKLETMAMNASRDKLELHLKSLSLKGKTLQNKFICVHLQSK